MAGFGEAVFEISIGGTDVTERFNAILQSLDVHDHAGDVTPTARVTLSDIDGRILMPGIGDAMTIILGFALNSISQVFDGTVDDVRSKGGRGEGRTLMISAHGFDTAGKAKEPQEFHKDNATLQDFMSDAAGNAGLSFQADASIGTINRDYWAAGTESFIHLGQRIAREVGATFKVIGDQAYMWPLNTPLFGVAGSDGSVRAAWGAGVGSGNLLSWDIAPILARGRFAQARTRYYDRLTATWKELATAIPAAAGGQSTATLTHRQTRADQDEAQNQSDATDASSQREAGSGHVEIVGEPAAMPDGTCVVSGVRPGVDGTYRIDGVNHQLNRASGFVTHLDLKQPQGDAGTDSRALSMPATDAAHDANLPPDDFDL
jgi:hypothetical protein